jgi:hypothetical protein
MINELDCILLKKEIFKFIVLTVCAHSVMSWAT